MRDFEGNRHHRTIRQRRAGEQDEMGAALETADDLGRGLLARKFAEVLLDVLNLERALLELVLGDVIFHGWKRALYTTSRRRARGRSLTSAPQTTGYFSAWAEIRAHVSRRETVRLKIR